MLLLHTLPPSGAFANSLLASRAQGEALALATKQAMAKAESIAKSLNGRIVRVVETSEGGIPIQLKTDSYASANTMMPNSDSKRFAPTPIQAGSLNIHSQVVMVVDISI